MNLEVFKLYTSPDPNVSNPARTFLLENMGNPQFLISLLQILSNEEVKNDIHMLQSVCLVLVDDIRKTWGQNLYSPELVLNVQDYLCKLAFSISREARQHIIECLKIIIRFDQLQCESFVNYSVTMIQNNPSLDNISVSLKILTMWSSIISIPQHDKINRTDIFSEAFFPIFQTLISSITEVKEEHFFIFESISRIFKKLIKLLSNGLRLDFSTKVIQILITLLSYPSISDQCLTMKRKIYQLFSQIVKYVNVKSDDENRMIYFNIFRDNFIPLIVRSVYECYSTFQNARNASIDKVITHMMYFIFGILYKKIYCENICTNQFVEQILVPCCTLVQSDVEDFVSMPSHYLAFALGTEEDVPLMVRNCCARVVFSMPLNFEIIPILMNVSGKSDTYLEACLYLISFCKSKRKIKNFVFEQIIGLLNTQQQPIIISSILYLLYNLHVKAYEQIRDISFSILANSNFVVHKVLCIQLIDQALQFCDLGNINFVHLIQIVLELSKVIDHSSIGGLLQTLADKFPNEMAPYSQALIEQIINQFREIMYSDSNENLTEEQQVAASDLIYSIDLIINNQPIQFLSNIIQPILSFCMQSINEFPNSGSIDNIIKLCGTLCKKCSPPPNEAFALIPFCCEIMQNNDDFHYLISEFAEIFCALIPYCNDINLLQLIINTCNLLITFKSQEESIIVTSLAIFGVIIQAKGEPFLELANIAMVTMNNEISDFILVGCVHILTSALHVTNGSFVQVIPPEIIMKWIQNSTPQCFEMYRDLKICFIGLTYLIKSQNQLAFQATIQLLQPIIENREYINKQKEEMKNIGFNEEEDMDGMEEEDMEIIHVPVLDPSIIIPFDSVDELQLFKNVTQEMGIFDQIPEEIRIRISLLLQ